jgi:hypothetical protein
VFCEGEYRNSENEDFKLTVRRIYKPKDLYLHLIGNCGAEIADELIEDVLCVLGVPLA